MAAMYDIYLGGDKITLSFAQMKGVFTDNAVKLIRRTNLQGGRIEIGFGALKNEIKSQIEIENQN